MQGWLPPKFVKAEAKLPKSAPNGCSLQPGGYTVDPRYSLRHHTATAFTARAVAFI